MTNLDNHLHPRCEIRFFVVYDSRENLCRKCVDQNLKAHRQEGEFRHDTFNEDFPSAIRIVIVRCFSVMNVSWPFGGKSSPNNSI
jgi:hypothetical protein